MNEQSQSAGAFSAGNPSEMIACRGCGKEIHITAATCPGCGASQRSRGYKSKTVSALLAFFLGGFGVHRFYLGQWWGLFYLLFFWALIPGIIALIECIAFLITDQVNWDNKYNEGKPGSSGESGNVGLVILLIIGPMFAIAIIGILAAVAIPAYQDYTFKGQCKCCDWRS